MKYIYLFVLLAMISSSQIVAQEIISPVGVPAITDPVLKDLAWNRYATKSFVIMSIDDAQGKWMSDNLEVIKIWCLERWGFPDFQFTKECRV